MLGLCRRTEGWAAGLQLVAITLRGASAPAAALDAIRGDHRHILDYFTAEVFEGLPASHRDLLVRASVLERLSGPLCDAVLQRTGSAAILDDLSRADLFVVALDRRQNWYRCHRLFRDALRHQLDPEAAREGLGRAADWFLEQGYLEDAIEHRIIAGDDQGAAELLRVSLPWFLERGGSGISRLGGRLAPAVTHADPALCVTLAWATAIGGEFAGMGRWLDAVEGRVDGGPPMGWHDLSGAWATLRAVQRLAEDDRRAGAGLCRGRHHPGDRPRRARVRDGPAPPRHGLPRCRPTSEAVPC